MLVLFMFSCGVAYLLHPFEVQKRDSSVSKWYPNLVEDVHKSFVFVNEICIHYNVR
jgi:hypothetical protein